MGNYFYKYQDTEEMLSPRVVDKKKEFDVYVYDINFSFKNLLWVAYANKSDQSIGSNVVDKCSGNCDVNAGHYGIIIDLAGESEDGEHPKETALHFEDKVLKSPKIVKCLKVGNASSKLGSICRSEKTTIKHGDLAIYYSDLFDKYIKEQCNGDLNWKTIISPIDEYPFLADLWLRLSLSQDSSILTHKTS
ncbi:hypothetical protein ACTFIY_000898 [Dictyostelium cf. discoideum]